MSCYSSQFPHWQDLDLNFSVLCVPRCHYVLNRRFYLVSSFSVVINEKEIYLLFERHNYTKRRTQTGPSSVDLLLKWYDNHGWLKSKPAAVSQGPVEWGISHCLPRHRVRRVEQPRLKLALMWDATFASGVVTNCLPMPAPYGHFLVSAYFAFPFFFPVWFFYKDSPITWKQIHCYFFLTFLCDLFLLFILLH